MAMDYVARTWNGASSPRARPPSWQPGSRTWSAGATAATSTELVGADDL